MKVKLWLRRRSISAPRMTVTTAMSWPARIVVGVLLLVLGALIGLWASDHGRAVAGLPARPSASEYDDAVQQMSALRAERDRLATSANAAESQLTIERSSQKGLTAQIKLLETENVALKEDLAFFERLLPVDSRSTGISIRGITAEMGSPTQLQYRLLVMQGGKRATNFEGTLRLSISIIQNGRATSLNFPDGKSSEINNFKLGFRHYQRLEGTLLLPPGATPRSLQATVLEKGQVRAQHTLNL
ncbi:DUF6776 family protein [Lacisediminimonas profundi]|uniref:DUF6776 family protein n=1 Tax=Lacisediminimonas profundi TaxID=2603856 RepID=UPI00124B80E5|nr:DUF6776 family protein [Lacisediminimonas profundi]